MKIDSNCPPFPCSNPLKIKQGDLRKFQTGHLTGTWVCLFLRVPVLLGCSGTPPGKLTILGGSRKKRDTNILTPLVDYFILPRKFVHFSRWFYHLVC